MFRGRKSRNWGDMLFNNVTIYERLLQINSRKIWLCRFSFILAHDKHAFLCINSHPITSALGKIMFQFGNLNPCLLKRDFFSSLQLCLSSIWAVLLFSRKIVLLFWSLFFSPFSFFCFLHREPFSTLMMKNLRSVDSLCLEWHYEESSGASYSPCWAEKSQQTVSNRGWKITADSLQQRMGEGAGKPFLFWCPGHGDNGSQGKVWGLASAKMVVVSERSSLFWNILGWVVEVHVLVSDMNSPLRWLWFLIGPLLRSAGRNQQSKWLWSLQRKMQARKERELDLSVETGNIVQAFRGPWGLCFQIRERAILRERTGAGWIPEWENGLLRLCWMKRKMKRRECCWEILFSMH